MGVGAGLSMYVVVVQKFTFAISSPDEFLLLMRSWDWVPSGDLNIRQDYVISNAKKTLAIYFSVQWHTFGTQVSVTASVQSALFRSVCNAFVSSVVVVAQFVFSQSQFRVIARINVFSNAIKSGEVVTIMKSHDDRFWHTDWVGFNVPLNTL